MRPRIRSRHSCGRRHSASAQGDYSHAEGESVALGNFQHTFGVFNKYDNPLTDWAPNTQYIKGDYCAYHYFESGLGQHHYYVLQCTGDFTSGSSIGTIRDHWDIIGHTTNVKINSLYTEVVGNGRNGTYPSNARALDWSGNEYLNGDLYINCDADSSNGKKVATQEYVDALEARIAALEAAIQNS